MKNALYSYVDSKLEDGLPVYLELARDRQSSYRTIAKELKALTGITVSKSSVHRWLEGMGMTSH